MTPPQIAEIITRNLPRLTNVAVEPDCEVERWETVADVARALGEG